MSWKKLTVKSVNHKRKMNYGKMLKWTSKLKSLNDFVFIKKLVWEKKTENLVQIVVTIGGDGNKWKRSVCVQCPRWGQIIWYNIRHKYLVYFYVTSNFL